jgi:hypothetical protein
MARICATHASHQRHAVVSLTNQLKLAADLLKTAKLARDAVDREQEVIESARDAYRHSMAALNKLPPLSQEEMNAVHERIARFRVAMNDLGL